MQIHHVETSYEDRWVLDEQRGAVKRREQIMKRSSAERIVHNGETYEVEADGTFLVPDDVAAFMCRQPGWHEGPSPFSPDEPTPTADAFTPPRVTRARKTDK